MSNEILVLKQKWGRDSMGVSLSGTLYVSAFVGGEGKGRAVQLTMDNDHFTLTEEQVIELIGVLQKRIIGIKGYNATD